MSDKRRRRLPRNVREQEIIDAALHVFSKRGYHAAVVDEIAELAGISKPMVYLYLGSKEGLFVACIRRESQRLAATFKDAAQAGGSTPEQRLWAGLTAFFAFVAEHRDAWLVLHRQAPDQSEAISAELAQARRSIMAVVAGLVGQGITEGGRPGLGEQDADFVAHALVGAADSLTEWMERHPGQSPERMTIGLMNMMWVGMRNVLTGEVWTPPRET
ncbi:TetR/AcrR family transcriptional regulator [Streptomyces specialis]|uniref:TetR/AcrR family transcriptional regulator n=1 Tax=Streptomyces specialis TaxID=498367 RepID=UPI00073F3E10|nr:TetR/AcrR family transcriptional regulator [Streptomyces specialis]